MHGPKMTVKFIKGVVTRNHNQGFSYSKKSKDNPKCGYGRHANEQNDIAKYSPSSVAEKK
jgi:hypothetical protein